METLPKELLKEIFLSDLTHIHKFDKIVIHVLMGKLLNDFKSPVPKSLSDKYYVYHVDNQNKIILIAKN